MASASENSDVSDTEGGGRNYPTDLFDDERSGDEDRPAQDRNENSDKDDEDKDKDKDESKKTVKPKKVAVRKPILLNEDMLCSEKGLPKLHELFKNFEFGSKGHEKNDLDRILHKLEHWIHVLHPKHPFDQTLERIEFLGLKKKSVKNMIKKIRMGMTMNGPNVFAEDVDDDEENNDKEKESDGDKENEEDHFSSKKNPIQDLSDEEEYPDLNDLVPIQKSRILSNAVEEMDFDYPDLSELESDKYAKLSTNINADPFDDEDDEFPDISEIELIENSILGNQIPSKTSENENENIDKNVEFHVLPAQVDTIDENVFNEELDKPNEKPINDMTTINLGNNLNNAPIDEEQNQDECEAEIEMSS